MRVSSTGAWRLYDIEHERAASKPASSTPNKQLDNLKVDNLTMGVSI